MVPKLKKPLKYYPLHKYLRNTNVTTGIQGGLEEADLGEEESSRSASRSLAFSDNETACFEAEKALLASASTSDGLTSIEFSMSVVTDFIDKEMDAFSPVWEDDNL